MKRPIFLVVGAVAALMVAAVGASAHTGFSLGIIGVSHTQSSDEASGARLHSPEPSESPEASATAEPTEKPEASPKAEPTEKPEAPDEDKSEGSGTTSGSGEHEGDHNSTGTGTASRD